MVGFRSSSTSSWTALVPILLQRWGPDRYGAWLALMAGFVLLQTLDLGHQNYIGNELNMQYHADMRQFRRTLGSSLFVAYGLGLTEFLAAVGIVIVGGLPRLLGVPPSTVEDQGLSTGLLFLMAGWLLVRRRADLSVAS